MHSSADKFWKVVEGWKREKSHIRVSFFDRLFLEGSFDATVEEFVRGESITFKKTDSGDLLEPLELDGARIGVGQLPYSIGKAKGLEELEFGFIFNIVWEDNDASRCTLCEVRSFGKPV